MTQSKMEPTEKLEATKKVLAVLEQDVPENFRLEILALALKTLSGSLVVKNESVI